MLSRTLIFGFTLIELMIALGIIMILSSLAIPSYRHYLDKARFIEVIEAVTPYKIAISLALLDGNPMQELNNGMHGIPNSTKPSRQINNINVNQGVITVTTTASLHEVTYILTPNTDGNEWSVSGSCLKEGLCHESN